MLRIGVFAALALFFLASANAQEKKAVVLLSNPGSGYQVNGSVTFSQVKAGDPVQVEGTITGLKPNANHGFHIHEKGDISSKGCASTGGHFNPQKKVHGGPSDKERHVGDLGNIRSDENGVAQVKILDTLLALEGEHNILGRGVVVHEGEDDLGKGTGDMEKGSKATGNAGGRIACGVIGLQQPVEPWTTSQAPRAGQVLGGALLLLTALLPLLF